MPITSLQNAAVQAIRRAIRHGHPLEGGRIAAEGPHLVEEALGGCWPIEEVWTTPAGRQRYADLLARVHTHFRAPVQETSTRIFQALSGTKHAQEILVLLRPRAWDWAELVRPDALIVVLDGIQDPGNAGTIVRSAEAFGATGVVFLAGTVGLANGKFLRASGGSIFRVPFLASVATNHLLNLFEQSDLKRYALTAQAGMSLPDADFRTRVVLAVGSEGAGISPHLLEASEAVSIPVPKVESLNAAVACSIALFEAARQRGRL